MGSQDSLIAKVRMPAESVGYGEKCRAISALARYLPNGAVIEVYRDILLREDEDISVKSEALNILSWCDYETPAEEARVRELITQLISEDRDAVVTTTAIAAAHRFVESDIVLDVFVQHLLDPSRDSRSRAAAFDGIYAQGNRAIATDCFKRLRTDPEFAERATTTLAEWGAS